MIDINLPATYAPHAGLAAAFDLCPLIAILRGVSDGRSEESYGRSCHEHNKQSERR